MLCDNDELEVHASHKHGVHCKYFQCKNQFFAVYCFTLYFRCTSAALWAFGCCLKCRENDELEVHASKPLWCALQIFSMQKIYFFAVFHFYMQLCCTLGIQVQFSESKKSWTIRRSLQQRNNCNVEEDILCCVTKMS